MDRWHGTAAVVMLNGMVAIGEGGPLEEGNMDSQRPPTVAKAHTYR